MTSGLETEDEINAAIDALEAELQARGNERNAAQQQLQESRSRLTERQTNHRNCEDRCRECSGMLETTRQVYCDRLNEAGFDSPEAHDRDFRDEAQLEVERETIGAQQQRIADLENDLERRRLLDDELHEAQQEMERWKRLQGIIPRNDLRDFALEIMFKQMGNLANEQLKYLTSERYQLKVESIGDLTVIDRWNANEKRPVETLSGGESFLTSLALALALSELSRGRSQLNSLFLDEGFGTLDTETLDIAIAALEGLRMQGRNIFLISHIRELTRRLPVKIEVNKKGNGSSSVRIQG